MDKPNLISEYWELVKLKKNNKYIILHFQENINEEKTIKELHIRIIPLRNIDRHCRNFNLWSVQIDLPDKDPS